MTWLLTGQACHDEHDWSISADFFLTLICPVQRNLSAIGKSQNIPEGGKEGGREGGREGERKGERKGGREGERKGGREGGVNGCSVTA